MGPFKQLALLAIFATAVYAEEPSDKAKKAIGIFNIVKFNNDVCDTGNNMNGTCFTAEECADRNGVASGSCADGYGVCCVITLTCGATTRTNCTYLSQEMSTDPATDSDTSQACSYNICPVSNNVRRIRLEMATMVIGAPWAPALDGGAGAEVAAGQDADDSTLRGNAVGKCKTDQFVATAGAGSSSPVICGTNSGQHMVLDTDGTNCVSAVFTFGVGGAVQRSYRIHVIQFDQNHDMGGPAGCLQYYTGDMGTVNSFNWQGFAAGSNSVHLANHDYDVCIRKRIDACRICWSPVAPMPGAAGRRGAFGISNGGVAAAGAGMAGSGASCDPPLTNAVPTNSGDWVTILNGLAVANAAASALLSDNMINSAANMDIGTADQFCGRFFNANAAVGDLTVCSAVTPFRLGVHFDDFEATGAAAAAGVVAMVNANEASSAAVGPTEPLGVQGFSLGFAQITC